MKLAIVNRDLLLSLVVGQPFYHRSQLKINTGYIAAINQLFGAGYSIVLITHQPGISRGLFDLDELEAIHSIITSAVENAGGEIAAVFYCPHDESDRCHCRPPETGLLDVIDMEFDCDTTESVYFYCTKDEATMLATSKINAIDCNNDVKAFDSAVTQWINSL